MKRAGIVAVVLVVGAVVVAYFTMPAIGSPSGRALNHSLTNSAGGTILLDTYPCVSRGRSRFVCEIYDSQGSGLIAYSVRVDGRCWRARKVDGREVEGPPLDEHPAGCVSLRDQLRPLERVL